MYYDRLRKHRRSSFNVNNLNKHKRFAGILALPFNSQHFNMCKKILYRYNINTVPKYTNTFSNIIKLGKDLTNKFEETGVVYKIPCNNCNYVYIDQTKRSFLERITEHKKCNKEDSVLLQHQINNNHKINWEATKILDKEKNSNKRLFSEMIHINSFKFTLNKIEDIQSLNRIYKSLKL